MQPFERLPLGRSCRELAQIITAAVADRLYRGAYKSLKSRETRVPAALTERLDTLRDDNWDGTAL
jgi:hypothetical protein